MRIDAHQHFWKLDRGDYGWLTPELRPLYDDFLPDALISHLDNNNFQKTIVVQAAPTIAETEYLLSLYQKYEFLAGVVGWLDFEASNFKQEFERLLEFPGFVGVRPMLQDIEDDDWILRPTILKNIQLIAERDFPIDLLIKPRHLPYIRALLQEFPKLRAVINHIAKPNISSGISEDWKVSMQELAGYENVMCKLSGMITETEQPFLISEIRPFVHHIIRVFGTDAIMFGSDWPVCLLAGSYDNVYQTLIECLPDNHNCVDLEKLFGENAMKFYQLKSRRDSNETAK
jgi:L-fuconolactonase